MNLNDWQTPKGERVKVLRNAGDIQAHYAEKAPDAEPIRLDDYLRGVAKLRTTDAVRAALSTGTDTAGGFTVPSTVMPGILSALMPASAVLQAGAVIIPLAEGVKSMTIAAIDTLPTASWRAEGGTVAESQPAFRAVTASPKSLAFMVRVSRELLADSPNMNEALTRVIAQTAAAELDSVGLRGTGDDNQPRGIHWTYGIHQSGPANVYYYPALAGRLNGYEAIAFARAQIRAANAPQPTAAIMSPYVLSYLQGFFNPNIGLPIVVPEVLKGMSFIETSQIPATLSDGGTHEVTDSEIFVGDFSLMGFVMREGLTIQLLTEKFAGTGELAFLVHMRADVVLQYPAAFAQIITVKTHSL